MFESDLEAQQVDKIMLRLPNMDAKAHRDTIYTTKAPDQVSWYRPHLEEPLVLIRRR